MREPTLGRRRRTRQQRLLRTAIGIVAIVAIAALIAGLAGGKKKPGAPGEPAIAQVAFVAKVQSASDASAPAPAAARAEAGQIVKILNDWYQRAFVDTKQFGDGTFPQVATYFDASARASFQRDIASLTIGDARKEVKRVDPGTQTVTVTVFFDKGRPKLAVAAVRFIARATMKDGNAPPLSISQSATLHFGKSAQGWVVIFYNAQEKQNSIVPTPSPSPS